MLNTSRLSQDLRKVFFLFLSDPVLAFLLGTLLGLVITFYI